MDGIYGCDSVTLVVGGYNIERSDVGIAPHPMFTKDIIVLPAGWTGKGYSALVRLANKDLKEVNNKGGVVIWKRLEYLVNYDEIN
ncbi:unnamed protein product [Adineta ricciae]|uniref:Uncharacterized protein n=1 Tax=Adineta ricciae TaxID=249248 RepID=A0A814QMG7_ADIRI|nr:unnamed protein product [Adineta ricciae]CAF1338987.1 unnamed protein product [Adineta ricciae]